MARVTRPLDLQLRHAVRIQPEVMAQLASSVHTKLQPTPSERLLILPPVDRANFLLGTRWVLRTWLEAIYSLRASSDERHHQRTSLQARRVSAAARRCRTLLGVYAGFWMWHEAVVAINTDEGLKAAIAAQMATWGGKDEEEGSSSSSDENDEGGSPGDDETDDASPSSRRDGGSSSRRSSCCGSSARRASTAGGGCCSSRRCSNCTSA
eukprot:5497867-Prymnesium_polylepis.2